MTSNWRRTLYAEQYRDEQWSGEIDVQGKVTLAVIVIIRDIIYHENSKAFKIKQKCFPTTPESGGIEEQGTELSLRFNVCLSVCPQKELSKCGQPRERSILVIVIIAFSELCMSR